MNSNGVVSPGLRTWFLVHFVVDIFFAIPMLIKPDFIMKYFAIRSANPLMVQMVAAALFAVGGISMLAHQRGIESYRTLLDMKLIWTFFVLIALANSMIFGGPKILLYIFLIFLIFFGVWVYYRLRAK